MTTTQNTNTVRCQRAQSLRPYTTRYRFYVDNRSWGYIVGSSASSTGSAGSSSATAWHATNRSNERLATFATKRDAVAFMTDRFATR